MEGKGAAQTGSLRRPQTVPGILAGGTLFGGEMKFMTLLFASVLSMPAASVRSQVCPAFAPAAWNIGPKALESVRVMSYPIETAPSADREYYATPPWKEREKAGLIYQVWNVNTDTANFRDEVDCVYAGTDRYVGINVLGARQCVARWRARHDHAVVPGSLTFLVVDATC